MQIEKIITLYREAPAACEPFDPRASDVAERVKNAIVKHAPFVFVEHIGSTAVPGCDGKGVVDLMVLYEGGQLEEIKILLDGLGFQRQSTRDPFPETRPMRIGAIEHDGKLFRLHVHVIQASSSEASELIRFRDLLRRDPSLRADYVSTKQAIIESGITDTVDYSNEKGPFIKQAVGGDCSLPVP